MPKGGNFGYSYFQEIPTHRKFDPRNLIIFIQEEILILIFSQIPANCSFSKQLNIWNLKHLFQLLQF
jgi:hypothetical protein